MGNALKEKFTIKITADGLVIEAENRVSMAFSAVEALMLLDILKTEEPALRRMAQDASPLPGAIRFS
jgi:hypothetical protein